MLTIEQPARSAVGSGAVCDSACSLLGVPIHRKARSDAPMVVSAKAGLELCGLERAAKRLRLSHLAEGRQGSASTRSRLDGVQSVENAAAASSG